MLRASLGAIYKRLIERGQIFKYHPGVSKFTIQHVAPRLRSELDRRILASANLIKLNRSSAIDKTLQRLSGWMTSIPPGGSRAQDKAEVRASLKKSITQLPYEERRVIIDQSHKFRASLNSILATDNGAIAAEWHSHFRQSGYDFRQEHKDRDGKIYLIRDSWAHQRGLVKPGNDGYTDQITQPSEEIFCRCYYRYIYNMSGLSEDMLTEKGKKELKSARAANGGVA